MRSPIPARRLHAAALVALALAPLPGAAAARAATVPPIVFVSRALRPRGVVPGLGPAGCEARPGGKVLVRLPSGSVRELVPANRFIDVAHPAVDWDGRRVVFAGVARGDSAWRLWVVTARGESLRALAGVPSGDAGDPCWLPDGRVVFASTHGAAPAEAGGRPAANLYGVDVDGGGLRRITSERNGAATPAVDPTDGHLLYARWWHARFFASTDPGGVTTDPARALAGEPPDLWQAIDALPDGDAPRLAGGEPRRRAAQGAYAPQRLPDGTLLGVEAEHAALQPAPGLASVVAFPRGFGARVALAGALRRAGSSAVAPMPLPDGRIVLSIAPDGRDFGLWTCAPDGRGLRPLLDLAGSAELDAAPLVARRRPPSAGAALDPPTTAVLPASLEALEHTSATFRFDCMNVFTQGPVDGPFPDAPRLQPGVRIRFFVALARPDAPGGDTLVLLREAPLTAWGAVHVEDVPADVPLLEQLVDAHGRPLATGLGPAHTASFNVARAGSGTRCVGCHTGHSALAVPRNGSSAAWVNAAPAADVSASDSLPGSAGARGAVDRSTRGPGARTGWVAHARAGAWLRLSWPAPVELREVVLYALAPERGQKAEIALSGCDIQVRLGGRLVTTLTPRTAIARTGTHVPCGGVRADAVEITHLRGRGRVGLAEVEALARLAIAP